MKTEGRQTKGVFPEMVKTAVSELKERLRQDYERTYPGLGEIIRMVLDEEEANARKLSSFPHLFLPDLVEARIATLGPRTVRHEARRHLGGIHFTELEKPFSFPGLRCPSPEG
jgi:hypothetical protein